jgi:hypothetical protein
MEGDIIALQDIFVFQKTGIGDDGKGLGPVPGHRHSPQIRRTARRLRVPLPANMFDEGRAL